VETAARWLEINWALLLHAARGVLADDTAHEAAARAAESVWRHWDRFDASLGSRRTWAYTIARRSAIDLHRQRAAAERAFQMAPARPHPVIDPERLAEQRDVIRRAWAQLSREERTLVALLAYGWTYDAAAAALSVPAGTLKTRVRRMRQRLRAAETQPVMGTLPVLAQA
jgi:RNA polymerase sigma-70 factor, ECF subfamily